MYTIVARMYDDRDRMIKVAMDEHGTIYHNDPGKVRDTWHAIHPTLNPTLDVYLERCHHNFGWRVEKA